ncbi:MAG: DUF3373 family protein [Nitrospirae bacterium]|nr:DUF3373 family protein [Nitrospirota bacterium]
MKRLFAVFVALALFLPYTSLAADPTTDLMQKIDSLSKELEKMKQQLNEIQKKETAKEERITKVEEKAEKATGQSWLDIGGDYRFRLDSLKGKTHDAKVMGSGVAGKNLANDALLTNRFGLNLKAKATEDIQVKARLLMYKVWGWESSDPVTGSNAYFADKQSIFDANIGHTPQDNTLRVDQAYATWSNVAGMPGWISVGRRPSTGGIPTNIRQNTERTSTAGVPGFMIDWAFDGLTVGYAPDIADLPGAYAKICYGKGFDSGFRPNNGLKDVDMLGINIVPHDTDNLHVELQWNRAFNIFASATDISGATNTNLGDVDQYGSVIVGRLDNVGMGDLNLFLSAALSKTHPNNNYYPPMAALGQYGLLWDSYEGKKSRTGNVIYLGGRYDLKATGTKLGLEYNRGSKNWLAFTPASDDMWTTKLGTRGNVYEAYIIQELNQKPISKKGKAFFRLGYQYYSFKYTGSQNWVGAPHKISDLTTSDTTSQMFAPLKNAKDLYLTFDVVF